ncbi:hypothetical protein NPIL_107861 [Nephila pilipes]|uniref:Uncharacterized protein n=1 Tax=Nephila pilipes TaxID=299642 RepID=A0A8X6UMR7_NEPPI|nr:hypothetical protein NPIL_107861 [Nephila pilipes]
MGEKKSLSFYGIDIRAELNLNPFFSTLSTVSYSVKQSVISVSIYYPLALVLSSQKRSSPFSGQQMLRKKGFCKLWIILGPFSSTKVMASGSRGDSTNFFCALQIV